MGRPRKNPNNEVRRQRLGLGIARRKLTINAELAEQLEKEGKIPRWINDVGSRLQDALASGYEFVTDASGVEIATGDEGTPQEQDRRIKVKAGTEKTGETIYTYLMVIPKKFYDEDQGEKEKINKLVDESIRGASLDKVKGHGVEKEHGHVSTPNITYKP